ncbi:MAG: hypothetical protein QM770_11780 [Tepidisphaeraceae bacterium]
MEEIRPEGPTRPIYLASRLLVWMGVVTLLGATCMGLAMLVLAFDTRRVGVMPALVLLGGIDLAALVAGVMFFVCRSKLRAGQRWSITAALVLAILAGAYCGLSVVVALIKMLNGSAGRSANPSEPAVLVLFVCVTIGYVMLCVRLIQCYRAIEFLNLGQQRGFAVMMPGQAVSPPQVVLPPRPTRPGSGSSSL